MAALTIEGTGSQTVKQIASHLAENTVPNHNEPKHLAKFLLGDISEERFLEENRKRQGHKGYAEFFVALGAIGNRDRGRAVQHLNACVEADNILGAHWWALAIRNLLTTNHSLMDWVKK